MWTLTTSTGRRVIGIACERDARWAVHSLGITEVVSPYVWRVRDNQGQQFIAQLTKERLTRKTKGTPVSPPRGDFLREGFSGSLRQRSVSADTLGLEIPFATSAEAAGNAGNKSASRCPARKLLSRG
jgi:hypothetical protein